VSSRSVFAAIVGRPNAGKSTLLNRFTGARIAIVSPRPQTTRNRIMGVATKGEIQYVWMDTPGYHIPRNRLGERMLKAVRETVSGIDCAVFVSESRGDFSEEETRLLSELGSTGVPVILALNKTDRLQSKKKAAEVLLNLSEQFSFSGVFAVSALTGDGCDALEQAVARYAAEGPHLYDDDTLTDLPEKVIASEIVREKLLLNLSDELPHGCAVSVESFKERETGSIIDIMADILCEKDSHKGMIIGKRGAMLKRIGSQARSDIEEFLGCRVNLQLWVKVRKGWRNSDAHLDNIGY